jgi:sugar lactone lactonase YvrE
MVIKYSRLSLTAAVLAACAAAAPDAIAVDHDNGAWVSNYWNTGKVLKE